MHQHTLDYSNPYPDGRPSSRRSGQSLRQILILFCALICGVAFVAAIRMRANSRFHQVRYQAQAIRYDSLLAAKAEADRQLQQLRNLLANPSLKH